MADHVNKTCTISDMIDAVEPPSSPPIDLSISDFATISKMKYYVDKTMLIYEMLNDQRVLLVTAPKLYGKSTMISMLKYFFEIQTVDVDGKKVAKFNLDEKSGKAITNTSNYELFKNWKVANNLWIMKHLGKYPVIHLDLKAVVERSCGEQALYVCQTAIHKSYLDHRYLEKSRKVSCDVRKLVSKWCNEIEFKNTDWSDVLYAIEFLSRYLFEHWGKRCIFLVDEYNSLIRDYTNSLSDSARKEYLAIQKELGNIFLFALKTNNCIERAFLTGRTQESTQWLPIKNLKWYNVLDRHVYSSFYGLSDEEVKILLKKGKIPEETDEKFRNFKHQFSRSGQFIYRMWSIMNYLLEKNLELRLRSA